MNGYVPYGWQFKDENVSIPSEKAARLNIFGMITKKNQYKGFTTQNRVHDPHMDPAAIHETLSELHKSFAFLSQEEQKYANQFLHDIQTGDANLVEGNTFRDYIVAYEKDTKANQIEQLSTYLGCSAQLLKKSVETYPGMGLNVEIKAIMETVDMEKALAYFTKIEGKPLKRFRVKQKVDNLLRRFITSGGIDIPVPDMSPNSSE